MPPDPERQKNVCLPGMQRYIPAGARALLPEMRKAGKTDEEYCRECGKGTRSFDRGRGVFLYDGIMRRSLVRYKYYGCREYGDYYGRNMQIRRRRDPQVGSRCDRPVPLYKRKLRMRGFNQSAYLARKIGETLGMPVSEEILVKIQNTRSQKKLERRSGNAILSGLSGCGKIFRV